MKSDLESMNAYIDEIGRQLFRLVRLLLLGARGILPIAVIACVLVLT